MNKQNKIDKRIIVLRIIFTILLLVTFIIIFAFSGQNGEDSSNTSIGLMYKIIDVINGIQEVNKEDVAIFEPLLRKLAHLSIYTTVGIWSMCLMSTYFEKTEETKREKNQILVSLLIGFLYACSDEIHQLFSNGRSCSIIDIIIDTIGVATGVAFILLLLKIVNKHKMEREKYAGKL